MGIYLFIVGLFFGSFYLVLGLRLPENKDVITSRSKCDYCNHILKWYDLVPLLSYGILRGKCRYCGKNISILNPIIELSCGILFLIGYLIYGLSYEYLLYLIISSFMIIIFVSDFKYLIINDSPLIVSVILVLIIYFITGGLHAFINSLVSGILMFFVMYLMGVIGSILFKKEALGGADIKLAGFIGTCVGFPLGLCTLILSVFLALPYSVATMHLTKNHEVAFGPFLIGALYIVYIFADKFTAFLYYIF